MNPEDILRVMDLVKARQVELEREIHGAISQAIDKFRADTGLNVTRVSAHIDRLRSIDDRRGVCVVLNVDADIEF